MIGLTPSAACWLLSESGESSSGPVYILRGVGDILLAIVTPLPIALALLFIYGLNASTGVVVFNSTVQGVVPEQVRGRVFTLRLLSLAEGGVMVDQVGIQTVFWIGGSRWPSQECSDWGCSGNPTIPFHRYPDIASRTS